MSFPLRAAVVLVAASSLAACHKVPVHVPAPVPSLNVPVPDMRLVIPSPPVEAPVEVQTPPDPPPVSAPPPRTRESSPSRPAQPPPTPPPATNPPAAEAQPPVLQTTAKVGEQEKRVQDLLASAERDLGRINSRELTREGQAQFGYAQQFVRQAKGALEMKNYVRAVELADRAATLAAMLVKGGDPTSTSF